MQHAKKFAKVTDAFNDKYFGDMASKISSLNQREISFVKSQSSGGDDGASETAFERRFKTSEKGEEEKEEKKEEREQENAAAPSKLMDKRKAEELSMAEKPAQELWIRASETFESNDYDAAGVFAQQMAEFGRIPTMTEVMYNERVVDEGRMKASANGPVPVTSVKRLRGTPACVEPDNFAPVWGKMLTRALHSGNFRARNARPLVMTSRPVPDVALPD